MTWGITTSDQIWIGIAPAEKEVLLVVYNSVKSLSEPYIDVNPMKYVNYHI